MLSHVVGFGSLRHRSTLALSAQLFAYSLFPKVFKSSEYVYAHETESLAGHGVPRSCPFIIRAFKGGFQAS